MPRSRTHVVTSSDLRVDPKLRSKWNRIANLPARPRGSDDEIGFAKSHTRRRRPRRLPSAPTAHNAAIANTAECPVDPLPVSHPPDDGVLPPAATHAREVVSHVKPPWQSALDPQNSGHASFLQRYAVQGTTVPSALICERPSALHESFGTAGTHARAMHEKPLVQSVSTAHVVEQPLTPH
jgi:hypothetical protein